MKKETSELLDKILFGAVAIGTSGTIIGLSLKSMKDAKKREDERIKNAKIHNESIANEIDSKKDFNTTDLIHNILSNDFVKSKVKSRLVEAIKTGRNKLSDEDNKQLYRVANNDLINDSDKYNIFDQICDGHVKTKEELESETRVSEAYYKYLTEKTKEDSKIKQFQIEQENSLKKNKMINETARTIFTSGKTNSDTTTTSK